MAANAELAQCGKGQRADKTQKLEFWSCEGREGGVVFLAIPGRVLCAGSSFPQSPLLAESGDKPERIKNEGPRD